MYGFVSLRYLIVCSLLLVLPLLAAADNPAAPPFKVFDQAVITHMERAEIYDGIAHYKYDAVVGPGEFDKIRIHRIVRESQPNRPSPDSEALMLLPGLPTFFEELFVPPLISSVPARDHAITIYLAKNGVDVWGVDYGWTLVPAETKDFSFMAGWGVSKDAAHVRMALHFARLTRWTSGLGPAPLFLAGLSYGAKLSYDVAAEEAHRPPFLRNVKGIVPMDMAIRHEAEDVRKVICAGIPSLEARIESGVFVNRSGVSLKRFGDLAITEPNSLSPMMSGLTNYEAALMAGAIGSAPLFWHFVGSEFNSAGVATTLRFTDDRLWFDVIASSPPYAPLQIALDNRVGECAEVTTPAHNPYRHIRVPVFAVGAAGGYGANIEYSARLTGSRDIQILIVQMLRNEERLEDFGHGDLVTARDAQNLVWAPILNWIKAHR